jgi:beta-mannosidase
MATYLVENFKYSFELEAYIYITQLNQSEAMTCALRAWRRDWKGVGKENCGGSLIWQVCTMLTLCGRKHPNNAAQFSPTWQVTSKSLIDYYNRPKMAYFTVKRDMAPISLGIERKEIKTPRSEFTRAFTDTEIRVLAWATNVTLETVSHSLTINAFELSTGKELFSRTEVRELGANITTELFDIELPKSPTPDEAVIISTCLKTMPSDGSDGTIIARCTNWPQPYRYLMMPKPKLTITVDGDTIAARANLPVKGLAFYVEDVDEVKFEDNLIDLVPGDEQVVIARGLNGRAVTWRYYGMDH